MSEDVKIEIVIPAEDLSKALVDAISSRRGLDTPLQDAVALATRQGQLTARIREGIKLALEDPNLPRRIAGAYMEGIVDAVKARARGQVRNARAVDFQRALDALRLSGHQASIDAEDGRCPK